MDEKNELKTEGLEEKEQNIEEINEEVKETPVVEAEKAEDGSLEELQTALEEESENIGMNSNERVSFFQSLKAVIIDQLVLGAISIIAFYVLDFILKLTGYHIVKQVDMTFIIFVILTIIYTAVMESNKDAATVGKKTSNLFVAKVGK